MPFNVLLLPLLGGYFFITHCNRTRFATRRYSGERLIFHAAIAGVFLLLLAFLIVLGLQAIWPQMDDWWRSYVPFSYSGTSALAFFLGWALVPIANFFFARDKQAERVVAEWNDYLEMLLGDALRTTEMVSITTRSRKAYVGFVTTNFDPAFERRYITLIPTISGYRSDDDLQLAFTTNYVWVYQQLIQSDPARLLQKGEDFQIIIPVSEIVSANRFNPRAYDLFNTLPSDNADLSTRDDS